MDAFIQFFTSVDVTLSNKLLEVMYILIGLVSVYTGVRNAKDSTNEKRVGSAVFWIVLGVLFIFGKWIPAAWTGALLFVMVIPAIAGQVEGERLAARCEEVHGVRAVMPGADAAHLGRSVGGDVGDVERADQAQLVEAGLQVHDDPRLSTGETD